FEERLGEGGHFNIGCFLAQQAGEKALKACLYALGERVVLTHSLRTMVEKLVVSEPTFGTIHHEATRLDRLYIPTRYPNGWPYVSALHIQNTMVDAPK
ncbi:MAG: HEPN domain-containing protein, partial [Desulforhabdus sp.]|nr:HEPN domain-containing protein [Desulforhabdus sp.]